jgi:predicted nucleotidyltransferase
MSSSCKFGLTDNDYALIKQALAPLYQQQAIVWCFGSRARGDHSTYSDLDLLIECNTDLISTLGKINEALVDSSLPIKVDLVQKQDFAHAYRDAFEQDKVEF